VGSDFKDFKDFKDVKVFMMMASLFALHSSLFFFYSRHCVDCVVAMFFTTQAVFYEMDATYE